METLINWESLGAIGIVLVVLALLIRSIILMVLKSLEKRETAVLTREEKLLDIMTKTSEAVTVHTETMREVQRTMASERQSITKQIRRSEENIKRALKEGK